MRPQKFAKDNLPYRIDILFRIYPLGAFILGSINSICYLLIACSDSILSTSSNETSFDESGNGTRSIFFDDRYSLISSVLEGNIF